MRYNDDIEQAILEQIQATPEAAIILPSWAYWHGRNKVIVHIDGQRVALPDWLYVLMGNRLPANRHLVNPPNVQPRNINPLIMKPMLGRAKSTVCPNGHEYTDADYTPDVGYQCHICAEGRAERVRANKKGGMDAAQINRAKQYCPRNHPLSGDNLIKSSDGKRRCKACARDRMRAYRAAQREARQETESELDQWA